MVATDQAAGTAGVKLVERPEPQAAINDVVVQIHASGFTGDELTWPSTWTDRLHGFPSSSHMFRNLIPMLADKYHVVAPDFPGYGESSAPSVNDFDYSFERLASVTEKFTEKLNLS